MKKIYSLLVCMVFCLCGIQAQKPFYVHFKDGDIKVFYSDYVDSITTDIEAKGNNQYVCFQKIWTPDSIYNYDVSKIDSISYITPSTIYKPDITFMDEDLLYYVIDADSTVLKLFPVIPQKYIPSVGEKLVCLIPNEKLPFGFAGKVSGIEKQEDTIRVEYTKLGLSDIYERFYGVLKEEDNTRNKMLLPMPWEFQYKDGAILYTPAPASFDCSEYIKAGINPFLDRDCLFYVKEDVYGKLSLNSLYKIRPSFIIDKSEYYISVTCVAEHTLDTSFGASGTIGVDKEFPSIQHQIIPLGDTGLYFEIDFRPFLEASVSLNGEFESEYKYTSLFTWNWSSIGAENLQNKAEVLMFKGMSNSAGLCAKGHSAVGLKGEVAIKFAGELFSLYLEGKVGFNVNGNNMILKKDLSYNENTYQAYDLLSKTKLTGEFFLERSIGYNLKPILNKEIEFGTAITNYEPLFLPVLDLKFVPEFSDLIAKFDNSSQKDLNVNCKVSDYAIPIKLGFIAKDEDKNILGRYMQDDLKIGIGSHMLFYQFKNLPMSRKVIVNPLINFCGIDVLARPEQKIDREPKVITGCALNVREKSAQVYGGFYNIIKEGVIAGMEYSSNAFGKQSKTFNINKEGNVLVSLPELKEETTYKYTAFVEWNGEKIYGETKQFTTKKKPEVPIEVQWVDLGLPSGLKWASCNVGATSPEEYGDYFSWGEVSPKERYDMDNYAYGWVDTDGIFHGQYLGDISGNYEYDAATANWGETARMPTLEEYKELNDNCSWERTSYNGVEGKKITGPNGNSIFIPASGVCLYDDFYYAGEHALLWSSTPDDSRDSHVYWFGFIDQPRGWYLSDVPFGGLAVRPVSD